MAEDDPMKQRETTGGVPRRRSRPATGFERQVPIDDDLDFFAKIPALVIQRHGRHIIRSKGYFSVTTNVDHATLAGDHLVKALAALQGHGHDVVAHTCFVLALQVDRPFARNWN